MPFRPDYLNNDGTMEDGDSWIALASTTLGSDTQIIEFESSTGLMNWSQYMDLFAIGTEKGTTTDDHCTFELIVNEEHGHSVPFSFLLGYGNTASHWTHAGHYHPLMAACPATGSGGIDANSFGAFYLNIMDINSGKYKGVLSRSAESHSTNASTTGVGLCSATWEDRGPVTNLQFMDTTAGSTKLKTGTRIDLFAVLPRLVEN